MKRLLFSIVVLALLSVLVLTLPVGATISPPTYLLLRPVSSTEISLVWDIGGGSKNSLIKYSTTDYPDDPATGDITLYEGPLTYYTLDTLISGTTYYFSTWGKSGGTYSTTWTESAVTLPAGTTYVPSTIPEIPPTDPGTSFSNMPGYSLFNSAAGSMGMSVKDLLFVFGMGLVICFTVIIYMSTGSMLLLVGGGLIGLATLAGSGLGGWSALVVYITLFGGYWYVTKAA